MTQNAWEILQISPDASKKEIRRAYAKLVKQYHPEETPELFERLHDAYQAAMQAAEKEPVQMIPEKSASVKADTLKLQPETLLLKQLSSAEEQFTQWFWKLKRIAEKYTYRDVFLIRPLSIPGHMTCIRTSYTESEACRKEMAELRQNPFAAVFCFLEETKQYLTDTLFLQQELLPESLLLFFYEHYIKKGMEQLDTAEQMLLKRFMELLTCYRRLPEYNCYLPYSYQNTAITDIHENNLDFWEYFITYGFDCRHIKGELHTTLTEYMETYYHPSLEWRKRFTNFEGETPAVHTVSLSDGTSIRAEFHLHYVLYEWNGKQTTQAASFARLCEEAQNGCSVVSFFFLLAVTMITEDERREAEQLIYRYLKKLPFYQPTLKTIAEALANDAAPKQQEEKLEKRVYLTLYGEDERFCFRILATRRKFTIYRYTKAGWQPFDILPGDAKQYKRLSDEERPAFLLQQLKQLQQPKPSLKRSIDLSGITTEEKVVQIIDALREFGKMARWLKHKSTTPYTLGFPYEPEELFPAVHDFFMETAGFMTNGFVILHFGTNEGALFQRMFVVSMNIFGPDLEKQLPNVSQLYNFRETMTKRSVQEIEKKFLIIGKIGFGNDCAPYPIALGESGTFYSFDEQKEFVSAETFKDFLGQLFDFKDVTRIEIYEGIVSVSKFDRQLEYCYTEKDLQEYLDRKPKILPPVFSHLKT